MAQDKELGRIKRHLRVRKKIFGTSERPRLVVHRSLKNLYVQVVDDASQKTLAAFSSQEKDFLKESKTKGKIGTAEKIGKLFADRLKKKGIQKIAFDRGGYLYHGRVKALAESLRQNGIQF